MGGGSINNARKDPKSAPVCKILYILSSTQKDLDIPRGKEDAFPPAVLS